MERTYDYQSAFDIIGPKMMGPSSSHTAGAVKIGNAVRELLEMDPEYIEVHYYESFAATHQGHGTDLAIIGGAMGYKTFDERIKNSMDIAKDNNIKVNIIEEKGNSLGGHPNCALIKIGAKNREVEVNGISIGGGTIKIKSIKVNGLILQMHHGLPILAIDGEGDKLETTKIVDELKNKGAKIDQEISTSDNQNVLVAFHLDQPFSNNFLNDVKNKHNNFNFSYIY